MRPNDVGRQAVADHDDRSGDTSLVAKQRSKMTGSGFSTRPFRTLNRRKSGAKPDSTQLALLHLGDPLVMIPIGSPGVGPA